MYFKDVPQLKEMIIMGEHPTRLEQRKKKLHYKTKEQWLISCLQDVGIDVEQTVHRRLNRMSKKVDTQEQSVIRQAIIASIIKQHNIKITKPQTSSNLEYLFINGQVVSIWNDTLKVAFHMKNNKE